MNPNSIKKPKPQLDAKNLAQFFRELPHLSKSDLKAFEKDIRQIRQKLATLGKT